MKKLIFLDRDGTIIDEPEDDYQVDSWEKFIFKPYVISSLKSMVDRTDYELVLVTNQDGLGSPSFPENTFWPVHNKMLEILNHEGIRFKNVHIDKSFSEENSPNRKPGTGMLKEYLNGDYDIKNSYVIGDRITDVEMAVNLGSRVIYFSGQKDDRADLCTTDWQEIAAFLIQRPRNCKIERKTGETKITVELNIDGTGKSDIKTGIGFFDHMLEQVARHGGCDLNIRVEGDLGTDEHHSIEDTAITLGMAFDKCLENKKDIGRYGFTLPMDDSLAQVAIDFGGRPWIVWDAEFKREKIGDFPTEMFFHFFKSFSDHAKCNLNIKATGDNEHHKIESIFKAFSRALGIAMKIGEGGSGSIPSTKGVL